VKEWSDEDVARRRLMLCPERRDEKNAGCSTQTGCQFCAVLTKWSSGKARRFCSNGLDARTRLGGAKRLFYEPAVAIEPIAASHHNRHKRIVLKSHWRQRLRKAILHRHRKGVGVSENAGERLAEDDIRSSVLLQPEQSTSAAENAPSAERRVYGTRGSGLDGELLSSRLLKEESCSGLQTVQSTGAISGSVE